jgi:hypothetical protein
MRRARVLVVVGLAVGACALAAAAIAKGPPPVGVEPLGSSEWPAVAAQLAKNIANDVFAHDYARVWKYLLPAYQKAVSQSRWSSCQRAHPVAPSSIKITKVLVANATDLPIDLALVGPQNVQEIELIVGYKTAPETALRYAVVYAYWLKQGAVWRAVWPSVEYRAYKAGTCYVAPQGGALY